MTPARKEPDTSTFTGRFASRLRELRAKAGLSREELANAIGVKMSAIANWENDINMPTLDKLPLIADALKMSVRNLLPKE